MNYQGMRDELKKFYWQGTKERAEEFCIRATAEMDKKYIEGMNAYKMKEIQYRTIAELFEPVIFYSSPFYYETGTMWACSDGSRELRGSRHAGGWTNWKNNHFFRDQDPELFELNNNFKAELFYTVCGEYNDTFQHFNFNTRPILTEGLKGIYEKASEALLTAETVEEKAYLSATCEAMLSLKKMSEKYAIKAKEMLESAPDSASRDNMCLIAESAKRTPWEKPQTFYEALNTYAFMRKGFGALDGVGPNTFGRMDMDLYPFYQSDIEKGIITKEKAYDLICQFLITWDMHFDHDVKMISYADHELENTYVIGGCDEEGKPLYNELTQMFLRATREEKIIFPKITCRYSGNSPKEYLDEINYAVVEGTSTILYQNDDATIPAMLNAGKTLKEARDYLITGCWAIMGNGIEKIDDGCYVNILRVLDYTVHNRTDRMEKVGVYFKPFDGAKSFEEVYQILCENIRILFEKRARIVALGGNVWNKVDPLPIFSATMQNCIENKKDYTAGGAKYRNSRYELVGFPNIIDSLLAIKQLCFDKKRCTIDELLGAVRNNWEGFEILRREAIRCSGWGDGSKESGELGVRLNSDLYKMANSLVGTYGGKIVIGHLTYTEIRWWGELTAATPDGRFSGDYIAQGLTPSRLKKIPSVTSVINSLKYIDGSEIGGNSVVNVIMPSKININTCEAFLRAASQSGLQSLQLNCLSKEMLLDAQQHPEKYPYLIVRVCGFSAKFTALSKEWQQEVITRNFYE